jgi:uncharacterized protein YhaN
MRLIELALDAYGPFAGAKLNFDRAARLHIVYGPNEAGKTSALAAIGDLFYGVPPRAEKSFLRPAELRLGAMVEARNGQILQFCRRRGTKAALQDAAGAALPDDCLAPFLGAASREIFARAFGLCAEALRKGGDEMLRADGEMGASLFAAASGLRDLVGLRKRLETEADEVFGERKAGHRSFYQALDRFDLARKAERDATLSETALKTLRRQIETADTQLAEIKALDVAEAAEHRRLGRLLKAAPILNALARLRGEAALFDDLAGFSQPWADRLETLLAAWETMHGKAEAALQARNAAQDEVAQAQYDALLLAHAEAIDALAGEAGAEQKALDDLPRRETALRACVDKLRARAFACGFDDMDGLRGAAPDASALLRAESLISRGRELAAQKIDPQASLQRERQALATLRAQQGDAPPDIAALQEKLAAFGAVEAEEASCAELAEACAIEARQLDERRARLAPALPDLDLFAQAPSPDAAAIEQAAQAFDVLAVQRTEAKRQAEDAQNKLVAAEARLRALQKSGAIASRDDLRALRGKRDAHWPKLSESRDNSALWQAQAELFLAIQAQVDASADALIGDAARVAEAEAERDAMAVAQRALGAMQNKLQALAAEAETVRDAWARSWAHCGVTPAAPRAMARWRAEADHLMAARQKLLAQQARRDGLQERLRLLLAGLEPLAAAAGLPPLPLGAGAQARRIAARLKDFAREKEEAGALTARIAAAEANMQSAERRLADLTEAENAWRADYAPSLAMLRLDADTPFDEAQARIALWRGLPGEFEDHAKAERQVTSIAEDHAAFSDKVRALLAHCAPDLVALPALGAASALKQRLAGERVKQTTRANAETRLAKAVAAAQEAEAAAAAARQAVETCCAEAGFCGDSTALSARLRARRDHHAGIAAETERLALVAEGVDEAQLAEQAQGFDPEAARARLREIDSARESRREAGQEAFAAKSAGQTQLAQLNEGSGAEHAAFARESARAEIGMEARRWAVLKLASLMVGAGLEKHRQSRQDPLLARAGAIYGALTLGRYEGLRQDFGEDDRLHLLARRRDGAALPLSGLSEGARDQLYLALRLAFLEDYAKKSETPPFIADDLFASFDDARVAAGLDSLAGLSPSLQPILFTHHAHIVEIARQSLGAAAQILVLDGG